MYKYILFNCCTHLPFHCGCHPNKRFSILACDDIGLLTNLNMASKSIQVGLRQVKPILSHDRTEAKRRVLNLYKAWYRQVPFISK